MNKLKSRLGYVAAGGTLVAMLVTPFVLIRLFTRLVASTGVSPDETFRGGELRERIDHGGYSVEIYRPVKPRALVPSTSAFVQVKFAPEGALPPHVHEALDVDGDGSPDAWVDFGVPADHRAPLYVDAEPIGASKVRALRHVSRDSLDSLIARVQDGIVVRLPLVPPL